MEEMMRPMTEQINAEVREVRVEREGENNDNGEDWIEYIREKRVKRVEVPYFEGDNPHGYRVEQYFVINCIPKAEKMDTTMVCLEGRTLNWYQWWEPQVLMVT